MRSNVLKNKIMFKRHDLDLLGNKKQCLLPEFYWLYSLLQKNDIKQNLKFSIHILRFQIATSHFLNIFDIRAAEVEHEPFTNVF